MSQYPLKLFVDPAALRSTPAISRRTERRLGLAQHVVRLFRLWRRRAADRRELRRLDQRTLRDLGISPAQLEYDLSRPFWRELPDWRDWRGGF
jgi:uncharacterized protein YjiS (DUF1127 family)